jgi:hypothetical protein
MSQDQQPITPDNNLHMSGHNSIITGDQEIILKGEFIVSDDQNQFVAVNQQIRVPVPQPKDYTVLAQQGKTIISCLEKDGSLTITNTNNPLALEIVEPVIRDAISHTQFIGHTPDDIQDQMDTYLMKPFTPHQTFPVKGVSTLEAVCAAPPIQVLQALGEKIVTVPPK